MALLPKRCDFYILYFILKTMDKVQKTSGSQCYIPSSEPFRIYLKLWYVSHTCSLIFIFLNFHTENKKVFRVMPSKYIICTSELLLIRAPTYSPVVINVFCFLTSGNISLCGTVRCVHRKSLYNLQINIFTYANNTI
jgi:hypothetical protein